VTKVSQAISLPQDIDASVVSKADANEYFDDGTVIPGALELSDYAENVISQLGDHSWSKWSPNMDVHAMRLWIDPVN
jgi:hypothetical protein